VEAIPVIETERLVLRGWREDDFSAYAEMAADPEVMEFVGGALEGPQAWRQMAMFAGHWLLRGYGTWAVERRADGAVLGRAGLWNPEGWPALEVGWTLARHAWGHGYATEAARAAIEWTWSELGAPRLISLIAPENARSIRVAERLGMHLDRDGNVLGRPVRIYALDRPA
jgi:RimJ/RimL family protein N-acetyltransferase